MSDERFREDELVSAYLDNEATPAEVAEVERDATLLARVEQLRSVRDAVAAPGPPAPSAQREQAISAALGVADAEAAARLEAKIVPVHQPQRLLLALAAAVIVLAAVVGGGLIASRGGDDALEMASEATMPDAAADAEMAAGAAEEPTAELDMETVDDAMTADEAMPEEEPMAEEAMEEPAEYAEAEEPEPAPTAPSPTTTIAVSAADDGEAAAEEAAAAEPETDDPRDTESTTGDSSAEVSDTANQAVDLGTLDDLETFRHGVARHWPAQDADDAALTKPGECSASLQDRVLELNGEVLQSFVAIVGVEDPVTINAELARRDDGTAFIVYAAGPDCETEIQELAELPAP